MAGKPSKWTDAIRDQVIEMRKTKSISEIANHFNTNLSAFQKAIRTWRQQGYEISSKQRPLLNEVRAILIKGEYIQRIYTGKGWVLYHRHVWEQANGPIPDNYCIRFKDGDKMNCNISNLELSFLADHIDRSKRAIISKPKSEKVKKLL